MAHLLGNNPGHQDAGEILLSNFTQMALQMEAQRRLLRPPPGTKARRSKKGQKKQPQRGLGVAQLEKIRLEEQRKASQQLAALRQLQAGQAMAFNSQMNGSISPAPASIIPQYNRDSNHGGGLLASAMATEGTHLDGIRTTFCLNNVGSITNTTAPSTAPLDLFPKEKAAGSELMMKCTDGGRTWPDRSLYARNLVTNSNGDQTMLLQDPQSIYSIGACDQINKNQENGGLIHPFHQVRPNGTDVRNHPSRLSQLTKLASPSLNLERMMELSSFQSALRGQQAAAAAMAAVTAKRQAACGVVQQHAASCNGGGKLSEEPIWKAPTMASKLQQSQKRSNGDFCELTLRPPGAVDPPSPQPLMTECETRGTRRARDFLSLSVCSADASAWPNDGRRAAVAESAPHSATPSPISATTTAAKSSSTSTEEHMSSWSCTTNFFSTQEGNQPTEMQVNPTFESSLPIDLTLRL